MNGGVIFWDRKETQESWGGNRIIGEDQSFMWVEMSTADLWYESKAQKSCWDWGYIFGRRFPEDGRQNLKKKKADLGLNSSHFKIAQKERDGNRIENQKPEK